MTVWSTILVISLATLCCAGPTCRCLSNQPCWPSASEFSQLGLQLSKPLIKPTPPASACYPRADPSSNCTDVISHLDDGNWRSDLPGAMQAINFETYTFNNGTIDACYYNTSLKFPCEQGNIPVLGVDAQEVTDIQAAVKFGQTHNLRLVIKNTGHDFLGRSIARGGFMIWTHHLKNITYDENFVPEGAPYGQSYQALTLGAGVQWHEAYDAAKNNGRFIVGGLSPGGSVGAAGGWALGGGHSAFAPKFGLGVDNIIQITVVLASGEYVTANRYQHADLFWALRGGGGGTFGIVVTVTYRTHKILPLTAVNLSANFSTPTVAQHVITEYLRIHPNLSDAGWGGYASYTKVGIQMFYVATNTSLGEANATITPFFDYVKTAVGNPQDYEITLKPYQTAYEWISDLSGPTGEVGYAVEVVSRLMSRKLVEEDPAKVAEITLASDIIQFVFVGGGAVTNADPEATGLNPAWRDAIALMNTGYTWDEGTSAAEIERIRQHGLGQLEYLDPVSPNSGTYFNEASLYEKDFKKTFFGSHYERLKDIKRKYDASDLFLVAEGVASDDWDTSLNCRLR